MKPIYIVGVVSLQLLVSGSLDAQALHQNEPVPLKNWATPLYWQPNPAQREAVHQGAAQFQLSSNATSNTALIFVAVSPCRMVDTRGGSAGFTGVTPFNGPFIPAGGTVTFPVQSATEANTTAPSPCGTIPSIAQAYSLNLTVVPHPFGTPVNYVTMWPAGVTIPQVSTLNDQPGNVAANAAIVPAGTPNGGINVFAFGATDVIIDMNGFYAAPSDLLNNTALGTGTLTIGAGGAENTAIGVDALMSNLTGSYNTATGFDAMQDNTVGASYNTASGAYAMQKNTSGNNNTASGFQALQANTTGSSNTAFGYDALYANTTGSGNTAIGTFADAGSGNSNIVIGNNAGLGIGPGNNNIILGAAGISGNGAIVIGTPGIQTTASIAGISGTAVSGVNVVVNSGGQLGVATSSRRFKEQITDMGDTSNKLFQLRPVNFFYKPEYDDGSHLLQYGLIAEEVEKIYPEMVAYDSDGKIMTVKYQMLAPMLLNEVQKQNAEIRNLDETVHLQQEGNRKLEEQNRLQTGEIRSLEDRLAALEALLSGQTQAATRAGGTQ
jgi:hypothetical protein